MGIFIPSFPRGFTSNYKSYRKGPRKTYPKAVTFMYKAEDVWSAAAAATAMNGGYIKESTFRAVLDGTQIVVPDKEANKLMVRKMLERGQGWTEADVARGAAARTYWQAQLMKIVGSTANDFEKTAITAANKEQIDSALDVAVISSLVASAERGAVRDQVNDVKINTDSKFQGKLGEHLVLTNAEVINCGNISDFGKYRVDAKCGENLYTWWSGLAYNPGDAVSVKGKVKGHQKDRATGSEITQLNYVKGI